MPDLTVTYESGVLKPSTPLAFPEGQTLQIRILDPEIAPISLEQALQPLIDSGGLTRPSHKATSPLPEMPLSPHPKSDLEAYDSTLTSQNLLSESIIEDRGSL
jgi:predicted DNA-binding antitoxin AbrB/MazE fold protein